MTHTLHRDVEILLRSYARDLDALSPSKSLDARIEALVAAPAKNILRAHPEPAGHAVPARWSAARWALAAALGTVAVALGVFIGVRVERAAGPSTLAHAGSAPGAEPAWPPADFALWPTDSVAVKIPVEMSPRGTLVAVDGNAKAAGARYWVDIVVSNDGTVRIENIVPAVEPGESHHGVSIQSP